MNLEIPEKVVEICRRLQGSGETAWVVGGAVRDLLRGRSPGEFDLATTAPPQKVSALFRRVIPTGIAHGTVTVVADGDTFEVTTLRCDRGYSDGRHPDAVTFIDDIDADLARRDFTVNAIAFNPLTGILHDPFNGRADIQECLLRAVGEPSARFSEDALRILRAARFAATLGYRLDRDTQNAILPAAVGLAGVSVERKREELKKLLGAVAPSGGLAVLGHPEILVHLCPGLAELLRSVDGGACWARTLRRVDRTPPFLSLRLAALLLDARDAATWLEQFWTERQTVRDTRHLLSFLPLDYRPEWTDGDVRRHAARVGKQSLRDLLQVAGADVMDGEPDRPGELEERHRVLRIADAALHMRELAVDGAMLMNALQLKPGPSLGRLLERLLAVVIENPAENTPDRLIARAAGWRDEDG